MSFPYPTFQELEESAQAVIGYLKTFPQYSDAKVAIIGGMAVWKYFPNGRRTKDVDFIVNIPGAPNTVKTKLLQLPNGVFAQYAQVFVYKHPGGKEIQIDFTPDWQSPYVPAAAMALATITPNHIPYVEMVDLLALKVSSCGLRPTKDKRLQDARDAVKLADRLSGSGRVPLNAVQRMTIQEGLDAVATPTGKDYAWWNSWLHLQ